MRRLGPRLLFHGAHPLPRPTKEAPILAGRYAGYFPMGQEFAVAPNPARPFRSRPWGQAMASLSHATERVLPAVPPVGGMGKG